MVKLICKPPNNSLTEVTLPASKSISNRLLIAQKLSDSTFQIENLSQAEDTVVLRKILASNGSSINVGMAGTAFRFLTSYLAITEGNYLLDGDERMRKRPIKILVDQLRLLGANIKYTKQSGFPPLQINGSSLVTQPIEIEGSVSSQYISSLLLIAPYLADGLEIKLKGRVVSTPYIDMTLDILNSLGVITAREENYIKVEEGNYHSKNKIVVESDWSSAAFFYQIALFSGMKIQLNGLNENSVQGDSQCAEYFKALGVNSEFNDSGVLISKRHITYPTEITFEMEDCPDLIPSVAIAASKYIGKVIINGVSTLRIKESNRVEALKIELEKIGIQLNEISTHSIILTRSKEDFKRELRFNNYNDHRMAMCLAPLSIIFNNVYLENLEVVKKSFPNFWEELKKVGITFS